MNSNSIIFSCILVILLLTTGCDRSFTAEEIEQMISSSPELTRLDRLCQGLPKPPEFGFKYKGVFGASHVSRVEHNYKTSAPLKFEDVKNFYFEWANKEGWVLDSGNDEPGAPGNRGGHLVFANGNTKIAITHGLFSEGANYAISCSQYY